MTVNKFQVFALAAALSIGGAVSAHEASDDQMTHRDGKPVGTPRGDMAGGKGMGEKQMNHDAMGHKDRKDAKPMKHGAKAMHGKRHMAKASMKGRHMKRTPSVKHLRGHSEQPRSQM